MQYKKRAGLSRLSTLAAQLAAFIVLVCGITTAASAVTTLYVSKTPAAGEYGTIRDACGASSDGDTILIKDGTYAGPDNIGIFLSNVTIASVNGASKVIIDLQGSNPAFFFFSNNTSATKIQGLTIENGNNTVGAGVFYCFAGASPVISQCIFQNNTASVNGSGSIIDNFEVASPTFTQCQFLNNTAPGGEGGAIFIQEGNVTISQCLFDGNSTDGGTSGSSTGGAIAIASGNSGISHATLINDVFTNNVAYDYGAAIYGSGNNDATNPVIDIENCSFSGNRLTNGSTTFSAAVDGISGNWTINNSILYGDNTTAEFGSELAAAGSYSASVQNSDIQGGYAGTGNIDADPLYLIPGSDLRLSAASPAINVGAVNSASPTVDFLGALRDAQIDMGAYEFAITGTSVAIGSVTQGTVFTRSVATFTDSNGEVNAASAYSASINWGDGNTSAGAITQAGGVGALYNVAGTHTYAIRGAKTITVTITAGNPAGSPVTSVVTDSAAVAGNSPTIIAVSAPSSTTAGSTLAFTVTAENSSGIQTPYSGTLHFTSSDPQGALPADASPSSGSGTYSVTLKTSGNQTITATDMANSGLTGTSNSVAVSPAAMTHFGVSAPSTVTAGSSFGVTVTARDQYNNIATSYSGMVILASPTTTSITPYVLVANGTGTGSATFNAPGTQVIVAVDPSTLSAGVSNNIQVNPGPVSQLVVSAPNTATAGSPSPFTVTAEDHLGNTATSYTGTVHFTSTDPTAILPADTTLTNGTGTFQATFNTAGSETLRARDTVTASITGTATLSVAAATATHLIFTTPATAAVGSAFYGVVTAKDQFNNTVSGYTGRIHVTSTDASAVLPANFVLTGGAKQISIKLMTLGTQTITVTDAASSSLTATSGNIAVGTTTSKLVITGATTATAGIPYTFTVTAKDAANNTVAGYTGTVHIISGDPNATLPANTTLSNGMGSFTVTFKTATTTSITVTDTVIISIKGSLAGIVVSGGAASSFVITAPASVTSGIAFYAQVTAKDAYGNVAKGYTGTVHFSSTDLAAVLPANAALTSGAKQISVKLKTKPSQTVTATDTVNGGITGTSPAITVN